MYMNIDQDAIHSWGHSYTHAGRQADTDETADIVLLVVVVKVPTCHVRDNIKKSGWVRNGKCRKSAIRIRPSNAGKPGSHAP